MSPSCQLLLLHVHQGQTYTITVKFLQSLEMKFKLILATLLISAEVKKEMAPAWTCLFGSTAPFKQFDHFTIPHETEEVRWPQHAIFRCPCLPEHKMKPSGCSRSADGSMRTLWLTVQLKGPGYSLKLYSMGTLHRA